MRRFGEMRDRALAFRLDRAWHVSGCCRAGLPLNRLDVDVWLRRAALLAIPVLGLAALCLRAPGPSTSEWPGAESVRAPASANSANEVTSTKTPIRTERDTTEGSERQAAVEPHAQAAAELSPVVEPNYAASPPSGFALLDVPAGARPSRIEIELLDGAMAKPGDAAERWVLPENVQQEIEKRSETEFVLSRSAIDGIFERGADLLLGVQIVPLGPGAPHGGLRVETVRSDSLFELLGLESGDLVLTLAGQACSSLEAALNILERARHSDRLVAGLERRRQRFDLDLRVR